MDWIKKNWIWIAIGLIVIAVIVGIIRKNKQDNTLVIKLPKFPNMSGRGSSPAGEAKTKAALQKEYDACMESTKNIRLMAGAPHPCAATKDMLDKAESGYFMQGGNDSNFAGPFTKTNGLNVQDFSMGLEGLSLLEDRNI